VNDDTFNALVLQANEITRDSDTDLDWLDIDAYTNFSYTAVLGFIADPAHALSGWRHATRPEVELFYDHLSLPVGGWPELTADAPSLAVAAAAYTGIVSGVIGNASAFFAYGYTSTVVVGGGNGGQQRMGQYGNQIDNGLFVFVSYTDGSLSIPQSNAAGYFGHWLVQTTPNDENIIPEPSTFSMLAFGCIAMAGYTRLRRRRK
jgi:hypothetical protein